MARHSHGTPANGPGPLQRGLYVAGAFVPPIFLGSVIAGGLRCEGFSHLSDPVSLLGMSGSSDGPAINAAWALVDLVGAFKRLTQAGCHVWILITAWMGWSLGWKAC